MNARTQDRSIDRQTPVKIDLRLRAQSQSKGKVAVINRQANGKPALSYNFIFGATTSVTDLRLDFIK